MTGLIRSRMLGASHAVGDVLVFLDSHCEASLGWMEPMLTRIAENERVVICPTINSIAANSMVFHHG